MFPIVASFLNLFRKGSGSVARTSSSPASAPAALPIPAGTLRAGALTVSQEAIGLIIASEVGDKSYYNKKLIRPNWPGGSSGVTIGFGVDLGYDTANELRTDWKDILLPTQIQELSRVIGVKGKAAERLVDTVSHISIPWEAARKQFTDCTLPRYGDQTSSAFPGLTRCHPHVQGVMLSLVFNRGPGMSGPTREEMRVIRDLIKAGDIAGVPAQIRRMKRLWEGKNQQGLIIRREEEAKLVEASL